MATYDYLARRITIDCLSATYDRATGTLTVLMPGGPPAPPERPDEALALVSTPRLSPPAGLGVAPASGFPGWLDVRWDAVPGAIGYRVRRQYDGEPPILVRESTTRTWIRERVRSGERVGFTVSAIGASRNDSLPSPRVDAIALWPGQGEGWGGMDATVPALHYLDLSAIVGSIDATSPPLAWSPLGPEPDGGWGRLDGRTQDLRWVKVDGWGVADVVRTPLAWRRTPEEGGDGWGTMDASSTPLPWRQSPDEPGSGWGVLDAGDARLLLRQGPAEPGEGWGTLDAVPTLPLLIAGEGWGILDARAAGLAWGQSGPPLQVLGTMDAAARSLRLRARLPEGFGTMDATTGSLRWRA